MRQFLSKIILPFRRLLGKTWEYVRLKSPSLASCMGYEVGLWSTYAEYLLGDKVHSLAMDSPSLGAEVRPSWALILDHEYEFRRKLTWYFNNEGVFS